MFFFSGLYAQSPLLPNRSILTSTFNIFTDTSSGTCFTVSDNNHEYIVTAKHLFRRKTQHADSVTVKINVNKIETSFKAIVYFHPNVSVDLAVLKLNKKISQDKSLPIKDGPKYYLGQECLFLGYPLFNLGSETQTDKIPFVKKAIISAFYEDKGINFLLLDGHNNPGFSGGPVITTSGEDQFIVGVISGFINERKSMQIRPDRRNDSLQYSLTISENSGIIIAYPTKYITETITSIRIQ
jgi:S1-C subfamily serine protease